MDTRKLKKEDRKKKEEKERKKQTREREIGSEARGRRDGVVPSSCSSEEVYLNASLVWLVTIVMTRQAEEAGLFLSLFLSLALQRVLDDNLHL